ncbi:MAG: M48 family metalloprotease [Candidatus Caldatribacteriota bacterium]
MNYLLFLIIAVSYNVFKFFRSKDRILNDLHESNEVRRNTILSHFYWVFVIELFVGTIVAVWLSDEEKLLKGIITLTGIFVIVSILSFFIYLAFIKWVAKHIDSSITQSFIRYMIKEFRVYFAVGFLPILLYSGMIQAFQDDMGTGFWGLEAIGHIMVISVLSITCTVVIMMKLLPNCEVTEPEYLEIINKRLGEAGLSHVRVRWIEAEFKNAFVVGINFPFLRNQTMFIGRSLRQALNGEEFDAVICHELAHIKQGHMAKRIVFIGWHTLRVVLSSVASIMGAILCGFLIFGIEASLYSSSIITPIALSFIFFSFVVSYLLFFDAIRSQEYEADAIAVMDFGCNVSILESALKKLTAVDNPYAPPKKRGKWREIFSTHPTLEQRVEMLEKKITEGLPFNYYVSPYQKMAMAFFSLFKFRYIGTITALFCVGAFYTVNDLKKFSEERAHLVQSSVEELKENEYLNKHVNARPIFGHSNLYYVMIKKDLGLVDHFIEKGADPEKVLFYLEKFHNQQVLGEYLIKLGDKLDEDSFRSYVSKLMQKNPSPEMVAQFKAYPRFQKLYPEGSYRLPASVTSTQLDEEGEPQMSESPLTE